MITILHALEDSALELMDRLAGRHGVLVTQGAISTITYQVWECESEELARRAIGTPVYATPAALNKADVIYDDLQIDAAWTRDLVGFNFRFESPPADRPTGGKWHRFEFKFTPTLGNPFFRVWAVKTLPIATS